MDNDNSSVINNMPSPTASTDGHSRSNKKRIIVVIAALILLVIVAAIICIILINNGKKAENTEIIPSEDASGTAEVAAENTPLSGGSVTMTVGDKAITYNAAYLVDGIEATISSGTFESTSDTQNVFVVANGGRLTIKGADVNIKKSGTFEGGRGDDYSFYGTNAAIVVVGNGSSVTIDGATISTEAGGANAIVATASGVAKVENATIKTSANGSRGLHATFKGEIIADKVAIATEGESSATLATDRGEGTVKANHMTLSTSGAGSPLVYSTGDIDVSNSEGTATGAQIAVIEGSNSVTFYLCDFKTNALGNRNGADNAGIMIYQSMSGDAAEGRGEFSADGSTLTIEPSSAVYNSAPMFLVTNTTARIDLHDTTLNYSGSSYFISAHGTSEWGKSGKNGGIVEYSVSGSTKAGSTYVGQFDGSSITAV